MPETSAHYCYPSLRVYTKFQLRQSVQFDLVYSITIIDNFITKV